jgi:hypothetical protein
VRAKAFGVLDAAPGDAGRDVLFAAAAAMITGLVGVQLARATPRAAALA